MSNPYYDPFIQSEDASLIAELVGDVIYDLGIEVMYMPRTAILDDKVLNEAVVSRFSSAESLDIFIENTGNFMVPNDVLDYGGFGFGTTTSTKGHIDKSKFESLFGEAPSAGDIFYVRQLDRIFELVDVEDRDTMLSGGRHFSFVVTIQPYSYAEGSQHFDEKTPAMQGVESGINSLLERVDSDYFIEAFIDFSSITVTFDNVSQFNPDGNARMTFDSTFEGLVNPATFDVTTVFFDSTVVTFDVNKLSSNRDDSNRLAALELRAPLESANTSIECSEPQIRRTTSTDPFGFL